MASAPICSASVARTSLRATASARVFSRSARIVSATSSALPTMASSRRCSAATSPMTCALGSPSSRCLAAPCALRGSPDRAVSRSSRISTSVARSSNRRPKCASPSSTVPACHEPISRSPSSVFSHTTPDSSIRPKRCGSAVTRCVTTGSDATPGRGPGLGRGPGFGEGGGALWLVGWLADVASASGDVPVGADDSVAGADSVGLVICTCPAALWCRASRLPVAGVDPRWASDAPRSPTSTVPFKQFRPVDVASVPSLWVAERAGRMSRRRERSERA